MITKYQQGGAAPQQDLQQQVIQLVQAAAGGDQQATQQIEQIMQAAQQGDQQAIQIAQMIQQVVEAMKQQKVKAQYGAKLNYIKRLKGACPEGEELQYYKEGGMIKAKCGCKTLKAQGGDTLTVKKQNPVQEFKSKKKKLDPATTKTLPNGKYPEDWTGDDRAKWEEMHGKNEGDIPEDFDENAGKKGEKWTPKKACGSKIKKNK